MPMGAALNAPPHPPLPFPNTLLPFPTLPFPHSLHGEGVEINYGSGEAVGQEQGCHQESLPLRHLINFPKLQEQGLC